MGLSIYELNNWTIDLIYNTMLPLHTNALTLILFALLSHLSYEHVTLTYQAINLTCIDSSYLVANGTATYITLAPYNYVNIQIDLRHLSSGINLKNVILILQILNTDTGTNYTQFLWLNNSVITYDFYTTANTQLSAVYSITNTTTEMTQSISYLFGQTVSLNVTPANNYKQPISFLFVVSNQDQINLPYNIISTNNVNNYNSYFLTQQHNSNFMSSSPKKLPTYNDYWNMMSSVTLPYLPYFSNCQNSGSYLYLEQMIHNASECTLQGDKAIPINPLSFGSKAVADTCSITRKCIYDEIPNTQNEYPFWNTLESTSTAATYLFYISSNQLDQTYIPNGTIDPTKLVACKLSTNTVGGNSSNVYPKKVSIDIGYYQKTSESRSILTCAVSYSLYVASSANFSYQLHLSFTPLNHTKILINFGFDWYVYVLVFIIIGLLSNIQFLIFWIYHLLITVKPRLSFHLKIYLRLIKEIAKGAFFAVAITVLLTFMIEIIMNGTFFGYAINGTAKSFWDNFTINSVGYFASNNILNARSGRMGFTQIIISVYLMIRLSDYLIGKERKKKEYQQYEIMGRRLKPQQWNRGFLLFGTFFMIGLCLVYLYFAYSTLFNLNIWVFIVLVQVLQMVIEQILFSLFEDELPCMPLKLTLGVLSYLATMGAIDLYYFILGYLVDVLISTIQISYLSNLQQVLTKFVERKSEELSRFYRNLLNDDEQGQKKTTKDDNPLFDNKQFIFIDSQINEVKFQEIPIEQQHNPVDLQTIPTYKLQEDLKTLFVKSMLQRNEVHKHTQINKGSISLIQNEQQNAQNQLQSRKFQLILDCTTNMLQYMLQPAIVLLMWITYSTSNILSSFAIALPTCILYFLSSTILALFFQINIVLVFHVLELYLDFDYRKPIKQLLDCFANRKTFWITDEEQFDSDVELRLRSASSYSMSSQLYFIVSLYVCCMYLFMLGFNTIVTANHNIFKDPFTIALILFWIALVQVCTWIVKKIAYFSDFWGYASLDGSNIQEESKIAQYPDADQQTQQILKQQSMSGSSIKFSFKGQSDLGKKVQDEINLQNQHKKIAQAKLKTICKKLQPQFQRQGFRLDYAIKNKQFIKANIEKILPLVESFPDDDGFLVGKGNHGNMGDLKKSNKNCQPYVSDFLASWLKRTETNRTRRGEEGVQQERKLKKCNFCFNTWSIYYGYDGMCLQCSRKLFPKNQKQD